MRAEPCSLQTSTRFTSLGNGEPHRAGCRSLPWGFCPVTSGMGWHEPVSALPYAVGIHPVIHQKSVVSLRGASTPQILRPQMRTKMDKSSHDLLQVSLQ